MKKLNEEEARVILNKGTEAPFSGKYNIFMKKGSIFASNAGLSFIDLKINSSQVVDGQALMMKSKGLLKDFLIKMAFARKLYVQIAMAI